jgi:glycosyltransferase involved in cell wall biosynthesis
MDTPVFRRVLALRNKRFKHKVLLANLRDCAANAHLELALLKAAADAGAALDVVHAFEREHGLPRPYAGGFRVKYSGMDNLKTFAGLTDYSAVLLLDLPYKDEALPAWLWLAFRAGGAKHFAANDNLLQRGHLFAMDMAEELKVFRAFRTASVVDQHSFKLWSRFGRPGKFLARPLAVDCGHYAPSAGAAGNYVLSFGGAGRDYAALVKAAAFFPPGLKLKLRTDLPVTIPPALKGRVEIRPEPEDLNEMKTLIGGAAAVALPVKKDAGNPGAGLTAALLALAMGKPPVIGRNPTVARYLEDGRDAFLYPTPEPKKIAAAVKRALAAGPAAGAAARRSALARFDLNAFSEELLRRILR